MPFDQLLPAVLTFRQPLPTRLMGAGPKKCIPPLHLSKPHFNLMALLSKKKLNFQNMETRTPYLQFALWK